MLRRVGLAAAAAAVLQSAQVPAAQAATPVALWSAATMSTGTFSVDGSLVVLSGNTSAGGRIEIRQASTGALVRAVTNSIGYDATALSLDRQTVAASANAFGPGNSLIRTVLLYRVSDGTLLRTITTDATRDITSLDFSPDGQLLAAMDQLSYGQGGRVRVFRVAT